MIRVGVDLANPGQFFGCCGVFEMAQRLWPAATAHFDGAQFVVSEGDLGELVDRVGSASVEVLEPGNETSSALWLAAPFEMRVDWWKAERGLKTWAGRMSVDRIATSLQRDLTSTLQHGFFDCGHVVFGADGKKVEPYYFDARRGATALPLDVGFSADALQVESVAFPATEFFTLLGLQRFRPWNEYAAPYRFRYRAWQAPLPATLSSLAAALALPTDGSVYEFAVVFRSKYNKAFLPAAPVNGERHE